MNKISTKYKIGDKVYVPWIEKGILLRNDRGFGVTIVRRTIDQVKITKDGIVYVFYNDERDEDFCFSSLSKARNHALKMIDELNKRNIEHVNNISNLENA